MVEGEGESGVNQRQRHRSYGATVFLYFWFEQAVSGSWSSAAVVPKSKSNKILESSWIQLNSERFAVQDFRVGFVSGLDYLVYQYRPNLQNNTGSSA